MAAHESTKTTKFYDRRDDELTLEKVGRISTWPEGRTINVL
jgi:hypothetical protein